MNGAFVSSFCFTIWTKVSSQVNNIFKQYFTVEKGILFEEEGNENQSKNKVKKMKNFST